MQGWGDRIDLAEQVGGGLDPGLVRDVLLEHSIPGEAQGGLEGFVSRLFVRRKRGFCRVGATEPK